MASSLDMDRSDLENFLAKLIGDGRLGAIGRVKIDSQTQMLYLNYHNGNGNDESESASSNLLELASSAHVNSIKRDLLRLSLIKHGFSVSRPSIRGGGFDLGLGDEEEEFRGEDEDKPPELSLAAAAASAKIAKQSKKQDNSLLYNSHMLMNLGQGMGKWQFGQSGQGWQGGQGAGGFGGNQSHSSYLEEEEFMRDRMGGDEEVVKISDEYYEMGEEGEDREGDDPEVAVDTVHENTYF
jgi:hypothetical protein